MVVRDEMMMRVNAMEIRGLLENQRGEGLGRGRKKDEDEAQHASSEFSVVRTRVVAGLRRCCCLQIDRGGGGVTNHELSCLGNGQVRVIGKARWSSVSRGLPGYRCDPSSVTVREEEEWDGD